MSDFDKFMSNLDRSHDAVWQVARWLVSRGNKVTVNTTSKAKSADELQYYTDEGDLYINQRIEVKGLGADFTCAEDWAFGENFMVCAKHSYDRSNPKPYSYIYLNKARTHIAILDTKTYSQWTVKKFKDRRYENMVQDFYICPTKLLKFMEYKL
jgi:hypothetical protein